MTTALPRPVTALAVSLLATFAAAQTPRPLPDQIRDAVALQRLDGELWALGHDFKAAFREDCVTFTPALGERAERNFPLSLRTESIGRGPTRVAVDATAARENGLRASYDRGTVVERHDVSPRGLAMSFVFDRLPDGRGDLVVRLAVTTELPLTHIGNDGLRFERSDLGGVAIGGVTGIDARGERIAGSIACDGATIELRLPAAFVDHAALPLVLDPQIGTVIAVTNSPADYEDPELAAPFGTNGSYVCAFTFALSASDHDIRAIRIGTNGTPVGGLFAITTGANDDVDPTVGFVTLRNAHVIAWQRGGDLFARTLTQTLSGTDVVGSEVTVASGTDNQIEPDLGSESTTTADDAVLVYRNATQNTIQGVQLQVSSTGTMSVFGTTTLVPAPLLANVGRPRISHHGGTAGRFLIVYPRTSLIAGSDTKPQLVMVDRNLVVLATAAATSTTNDEDSPDVDGDGDRFVVVFESEASEGSGDNEIRAVSVSFDEHQGTLWTAIPQPVTSIANVDEIDPAIACFRDGSAMVGWRRRAAPGSTNTEVFMKTIDQLSCAECEPVVLLANTADIETNLTIAAHSVQNDNGVVLWETSTAATNNGDLDAVVWQAADGTRSKPFGAQDCGLALPTIGGCARAGNLNHLVQVHGTDGTSFGSLILSLNASWITCGNCRLYADPFDGIVVSSVSGTDGFASTIVSIPPLSILNGLTFYAQWILNNNTGNAACSWLSADFSNAVAITIE